MANTTQDERCFLTRCKDYLVNKFSSTKEEKPVYPEYHFEGTLNEKQVRIYEEGQRFHVDVEYPTVEGATDSNPLHRVLYHAIPQANECGQNPGQKDYDPHLVLAELVRAQRTIKLNQDSKNPRVQATIKLLRTNLEGFVAEAYKANTAGI